MPLAFLSTDVLILILRNLHVQDLESIACSCRFFRAFVLEHGWLEYLRTNPRPSYSLAKTRASCSPRASAYYDARTDFAWTQSAFVARPLSHAWNGMLQPALAMNPFRLLVAAGNTIYSYKSTVSLIEHVSPPMISEGRCRLSRLPAADRDLTAITFADDSHPDSPLYIGFQDGSLEHATIVERTVDRKPSFLLDRRRVGPPGQRSDPIRSLSSSQTCLLSLTASGRATLSLTDRRLASSSSIELNTRSWTSHLCLRASSPFAAFGTSSATPLTVHAVSEDGLRAHPTAILQPKSKRLTSSAVYGVTQAPASSPWGSSPQILVSGWFDGVVRCYDLRSPLRSSDMGPSTSGLAPLRPVLNFYVAAGMARHSVVAFWDIRATNMGWSVHAPANDPSPVYSIILESSRLFGVTQSRPFVYDFGPGVTSGSYPRLAQEKGSNPGFYVTTYRHY
ncbi:hypothetical protein APHAL10511_002614 [Amanita phalloides]|nr:hypothetical protein APHAL10511_002614 [Amanita phalloides]